MLVPRFGSQCRICGLLYGSMAVPSMPISGSMVALAGTLSGSWLSRLGHSNMAALVGTLSGSMAVPSGPLKHGCPGWYPKWQHGCPVWATQWQICPGWFPKWQHGCLVYG
jgi:hypothetical protein